MSKKINKIAKAIKDSPLQVAALALYLDIDDTTISKWNSNIAQPSLKRLDEVGEVLEIDNSELLSSQDRKQTGLASALQIEYKRLLALGLTKKVIVKENGASKEVNNPEMVKALRDFVEEYKNDIKK
jgi:transcriptional regulator with XRE-family HTH domain